MFVAPLFVIVKTCKQPENSSIDDRINKLCYIHTMDNKREQTTDAYENLGGSSEGLSQLKNTNLKRLQAL